MKLLLENRDFYEPSVLGSYDNFLIYVQYTRLYISEYDLFNCIFEWNKTTIYKFIEVVNSIGGIQMQHENRIFVVAPNPKSNHITFPWRVTHYYKVSGAICEELFTCESEAIIYVLLSYPDSIISNETLDTWLQT
ncbi:hypothetical protein F4826_004755 [Rahnella inusitata]|nr:hypothetical protein [Rahnella inusitata]